jgi:predicted amidohydrolase
VRLIHTLRLGLTSLYPCLLCLAVAGTVEGPQWVDSDIRVCCESQKVSHRRERRGAIRRGGVTVDDAGSASVINTPGSG